MKKYTLALAALALVFSFTGELKADPITVFDVSADFQNPVGGSAVTDVSSPLPNQDLFIDWKSRISPNGQGTIRDICMCERIFLRSRD